MSERYADGFENVGTNAKRLRRILIDDELDAVDAVDATKADTTTATIADLANDANGTAIATTVNAIIAALVASGVIDVYVP